MDVGQDRAQLSRHRPPSLGVDVVAQKAARDRLALNPFHEEGGHPKRVVAHEMHLRYGNTFLAGSL